VVVDFAGFERSHLHLAPDSKLTDRVVSRSRNSHLWSDVRPYVPLCVPYVCSRYTYVSTVNLALARFYRWE
jgi:hypothetical protein